MIYFYERIIQSFWTFEIKTQEGKNVPIWVIVRSQQKDRQDSQNLNNDAFHRPRVTSAQYFIGTQRYPDAAIPLV